MTNKIKQIGGGAEISSEEREQLKSLVETLNSGVKAVIISGQTLDLLKRILGDYMGDNEEICTRDKSDIPVNNKLHGQVRISRTLIFEKLKESGGPDVEKLFKMLLGWESMSIIYSSDLKEYTDFITGCYFSHKGDREGLNNYFYLFKQGSVEIVRNDPERFIKENKISENDARFIRNYGLESVLARNGFKDLSSRDLSALPPEKQTVLSNEISKLGSIAKTIFSHKS